MWIEVNARLQGRIGEGNSASSKSKTSIYSFYLLVHLCVQNPLLKKPDQRCEWLNQAP